MQMQQLPARLSGQEWTPGAAAPKLIHKWIKRSCWPFTSNRDAKTGQGIHLQKSKDEKPCPSLSAISRLIRSKGLTLWNNIHEGKSQTCPAPHPSGISLPWAAQTPSPRCCHCCDVDARMWHRVGSYSRLSPTGHRAGSPRNTGIYPRILGLINKKWTKRTKTRARDPQHSDAQSTGPTGSPTL